MTEYFPPGINNEEVVLLGVVSLAPAAKMQAVYATAHDPCMPMPAVDASTHADAGTDTEASNIIAFFNPQAKSQHSKEAKVQHAPWMLQNHSKHIWRYDYNSARIALSLG